MYWHSNKNITWLLVNFIDFVFLFLILQTLVPKDISTIIYFLYSSTYN